MKLILAGTLSVLFALATGCGSPGVVAKGGGYVLQGARPTQGSPRAMPPTARRGGLTPPSGSLGDPSRARSSLPPVRQPARQGSYPGTYRPPTTVYPGAIPSAGAPVNYPPSAAYPGATPSATAAVNYPPPAAGIGSPPASYSGPGRTYTPSPTPGPSVRVPGATLPPAGALPPPIFAPIPTPMQPVPRPLSPNRPLGEKELALDTDSDARVDTWIRVTEGRITRVSRDTDRDGKVDLTSSFSRDEGLPMTEVQYKGATGQVALKTEFEGGVKTRREADENGDGNPDHWWYYLGGELSKEAWDRDSDGKIDEVKRYRSDNLVTIEYDEDRDGKFEKTDALKGGTRVSSEITDREGILRLVYNDQGTRVIRRERDRNGDGIADIIVVLDGVAGIKVREDRDLNADGRPDVSAYYESGKLARREISGEYLRAQKRPGGAAPSVDVEKRDFRKLTGS